MAGIVHAKTLSGPDGTNADRAQPSDWNDDHDITGDIDLGSYDITATEGTFETVEVSPDGPQTEVSSALGVAIDGSSYARNIVSIRSSANNNGPVLDFYKSRGGLDAPDDVSNADVSGSLRFFGYDSTAGGYVQNGGIDVLAASPGGGTVPGNIYIKTRGSDDSYANRAIFYQEEGIRPGADSTYQLGHSAVRWANIYTDAINLGDEDLTDYDEGTWTPTLTFATPGDLSVVYSTQTGTYTRVGRMVFAQCYITTTTFTHTTASGNLVLGGLPFTVASGFAHMGPVQMRGWTDATNGWLTVRPVAASTQAYFPWSRTGASVTNLSTTLVPTGGTLLIGATLIFFV